MEKIDLKLIDLETSDIHFITRTLSDIHTLNYNISKFCRQYEKDNKIKVKVIDYNIRR